MVASSIRLACAGEPTPAPAPEPQSATQPQVAGTEPPLAIAPFDAAQAKRHQEAWAAYLGVPVELTNSIGIRLLLIPPGEFMMGSPDSDEDAAPAEKPQHRVRITRPFYLGKFEVTQEQHERITGSNPNAFGGPQHPVQNANGDYFCEKLSALPQEKAAHRSYRLPREAEWEYACRAGSTTRYSSGDDASGLGSYAWFDANSSATVHSVGEKLSNAWRLHDMQGNLWEWCADWYAADYFAHSPLDDPPGPAKDSIRPDPEDNWHYLFTPSHVLRGGSWNWRSTCCRPACRVSYHPLLGALGFRVALDVPGKNGQPAEGR
jgi:formylglycine-generating enzyme required for sulfatase activity